MKNFLLITSLFCFSIIKAQIITTVVGTGYGAGNGQGNYSGDGGLATVAEMHGPYGIAFDKHGNLFIVENVNGDIRKVNTKDTISKYAGVPLTLANYNGDTGNANAIILNNPLGMAVDAKGNVYFADTEFGIIRKTDTQHHISVYAGNHFKAYTNAGGYNGGYGGDGGIADSAILNQPADIAFDKYGNMYIADAGNNLIRKVDTLGIISTIAGDTTGASNPYCGYYCNAGYNGDSILAKIAKLNNPMGITCDKAGNLYIADYNNQIIRKIDSLGIITTVAGTPTSAGYSGNGGQATLAKLSTPRKVCFDSYGNMYIAEEYNHVIRKVNTAGIISTFVGTGGKGYTGNNGPATSATLNQPCYVICDTLNNLYISDFYNNVIRRVTIPNPNIQWAVIPDANFANYLRILIPTAMNGDSLNTQSPLVTTTTYSINLQNNFISNLTGIQYFTSLTYLNCQGNQLTSIPTLPNSIVTFDCSYNYNLLTSLPALPTSLQFLGCHDNALTSLPTLPSTLQTLYCNFNQITCFPNIPNSVINLIMHNNPYDCLPNYIAAMNSDTVTYPLCVAGNSHGCTVSGISTYNTQNATIQIYPNPAGNKITIDANYLVEVKLFDVLGKEITATKEKEIDTSNFTNGVYFIQIKTNTGTSTQKIIVQH